MSMKLHFGIGQKVLFVVVAILILFTIGLSAVIGTTSFNNLTAVKQAELSRMSQILASRISELEQNAVLTVRSFEENEKIVSDIQLLTNLGPYYADPGSYLAADFMGGGAAIEDADKIYVFQSQLDLIQLLQPVQRLDNLTSISFYLLSPFELAPDAQPVLAIRLDQEEISVAQFANKGDVSKRVFYQVPVDQFSPPAPDYFDISSAYSASPIVFYVENGFQPTGINPETEFFSLDWQKDASPRSQVVIKAGIPMIQTWYPVKVPIAHPDTWVEEVEPVGLAMVEQRLDTEVIALLKNQLGLDVGFAQDDQLLITSLGGLDSAEAGALYQGQTVSLAQDEFYFAQESIDFPGSGGSNLQAVVLSPVSELEQLTELLRLQIVKVAVGTILLTSLIVYLSIQYFVNRPLKALMGGVQLISAGDLTQTVAVQSHDEAGQLAQAFNAMTGQLRQTLAQLQDLVDSLEQRVATRTRRLEIVAALSERLSAILEVEALLAEVVNQVKDNFNYYHAHIYLLDENEGRLAVAAGTGEAGVQMRARGHNIPLDAPTSLVARAARHGEIVRVDNVRDAEDWLPNDLLPDTYSEMAVPITLEGQVVGVLDVQEDKIAGLDEGDASLLRTLANQVAVAIRNARLFEQVESALAEVQAAQARYVEQSWRETEVASRFGQHLYTRATAASPDPAKEQVMALARQQALVQSQPAVVTLEEDNADLKSLIAPIKLRDKAIGALQLHASGNDRIWDEDDLAVIEAVADQLAQSAENLRLFEDTRQLASREQAIREISERLQAATSIEELVQTVANELGMYFSLEYAGVELGIDED